MGPEKGEKDQDAAGNTSGGDKVAKEGSKLLEEEILQPSK